MTLNTLPRLCTRKTPAHFALMSLLALAPIVSGCASGQMVVDPPAPTGADRSQPWITPASPAAGVQLRVFESVAASGPVSYHVYLPEGYTADPQRRYPVLYWLHGTQAGIGGIGPLSAFFGEAMRSERIPPMLVVFPNGMAESMWTNSKDGRVPMETVVVDDLVNHIDATFRTIARREGRILEGFSMGGMGAGRLGFRYHTRFGFVSMLGAGPLDQDFQGPRAQANPAERARILSNVWGNDLNYYRSEGPAALATVHRDALLRVGVRLRIAAGERDFVIPDLEQFRAHLSALDIPHEFIVVPGVGHQPLPLLSGMPEASWAFYREVATTQSP